MAFDSFLPRGDATVAQPKNGDEASELSWARARTTGDVEDTSFERTSRFPFAGRSVTLWDEVSPAPRGMSETGDDPPDE